MPKEKSSPKSKRRRAYKERVRNVLRSTAQFKQHLAAIAEARDILAYAHHKLWKSEMADALDALEGVQKLIVLTRAAISMERGVR